MKITFLTGEYPPMQGGIADHTAYLAQYLTGPAVTTFILIDRAWQEVETDSPQPLVSGVHRQPIIQPILPNWGRRCWGGVFHFLKTYAPDILHIQYQAAAFDLGGWVNWLPWYLKKRRLKTRTVVTFHDLRLPYIFPKAGPFRRASMLALARHSHAVICTNREDLLTLEKQLGLSSEHFSGPGQPPLSPDLGRGPETGDRGKPEARSTAPSPNLPSSQSPSSQSPKLPISKLPSSQAPNLQAPSSQAPKLPSSQSPSSQSPLLTLIPLGSNVEPQPPPDFERAEWRKQYGVTEQTLLLAYFGFLNESKGGEELIEAVALLRRQGLDVHLLFIGGDIGHADPTNAAYAQKVQELIDRRGLGDVVHRTGYVDLPAVSANLLAADAVVMPYRDGVSFRRTTLIAALRHGRPIVSTSPAEPRLMPEIRAGENMLLAPPGDAAGLAQTITPLATNAGLRQRLSTGARQLGDLFEWDTIAQKTMAVYKKVSESE